jgi:hypothetical protein
LVDVSISAYRLAKMKIIRCCAIIIWLLNLIIKTIFMGKKFSGSIRLIALVSLFIISCQKSIDEPVALEETRTGISNQGRGVTPYKFERINENNFHSQGWVEQQVNNITGGQLFSDESEYLEIVCGPVNNSDPRLIQGSITMNLPTSADPTLRRIRLRRSGYSGTRLADLTALKYSTYVVNNCPANMVLQLDVNGDETKDFNIFYDPRPIAQENNDHPFRLNEWQQWNALAGNWHTEVATVPLPAPLTHACTIEQIIAAFPNVRIIDTEPIGHNGEGVRFTIGGTPASLFANTIGYFDALIIGTKDKPVPTLFDFTCNN